MKNYISNTTIVCGILQYSASITAKLRVLTGLPKYCMRKNLFFSVKKVTI